MKDLENFPTSPAAIRMMETVSPIYDRAYVAKWIYQVMGVEMDQAWDFFIELRLQIAPETATWGIDYWEQRFDIEPDESLTLEERRQRVIVKRSKRAPMNPARIEDIIGKLLNLETKVTENIAPYIFRVTSEEAGDEELSLELAYKTLKEIKPSHLGFELETVSVERGQEIDILTQMISAATTDLPEWEMDYDFKAKIPTPGQIMNIYQTSLPELGS